MNTLLLQYRNPARNQGFSLGISIMVLFVLVHVIPLSAQSELDSLKRAYAGIRKENSKEHVDILNEIAWSYRGIQSDSSLKYANTALALANAIQYTEGSIRSINGIGVVYRNRGDYGRALEYYLRAHELAKKTKNNVQINYSTINISNLYYLVGDYEKAMFFGMGGLHTAQALHNDEQIGYSYSNLGKIYCELHQYDESLRNQFIALGIRRKMNHSRNYSGSLREISKVYRLKKMYDSAAIYLAESKKFADKVGDDNATGLIVIEYARLEFEKNNIQEAEKYAMKALEIFENLEFNPEESKALELLSRIYEKVGDSARAYQYLKRYSALHNTIYGQEMLNKAFRLGIQAELDKKNDEITFLTKEQRLTGIIQVTLIAAVVFLALFVLVLFNRYKLRKKSERKLQVQNAEILRQQELLETQTLKIYQANQELRLLIDKLSFTNNQLEEASTFKTRMLSIASHDLKNPLGTIIDMVKMIRYDNELTGEGAELLNEIQATAERTMALVKDFLDTSALQLGSIDLKVETINMVDVIKASVAAYLPSATLKHQQFVVDLPEQCYIDGDMGRLRQVFDNLISNAVKYSPLEKKIKITVTVEGKSAFFSVKDEGAGISDEDKEKMFGFFQRLSATPTGGEHSSGVGLAIVKHVVELHNGHISVISQPGNGAEFIVELPLSCHADI